ncbi:hypothetical protein SDC9_206055 [bioreactor metagenome]|uniref:Uncharacterized protein n=1 Tax=bioreactor metagenome TaxID=1076179 RepID=A0A645J3Z4_9ZZZZ
MSTCLSGCTTSQQLAANLSGKSIAGSGIVARQQIVITQPETGTYTPEISSLIISGDFQSILKDAVFLRYDRKESSAWYNASIKTTSETFTINLKDSSNMADTVARITELMKVQSEIETKKEAATASSAAATSISTTTNETTSSK